MFIIKKDHSVICTNCNEHAKTLKEYERDRNRNNHEWFWEPWDMSDDYLYVCPKCKKRDFISDSEY